MDVIPREDRQCNTLPEAYHRQLESFPDYTCDEENNTQPKEVSEEELNKMYEDFIKISFRSKDDMDVNQFSRKYFNGGGHINAAGGKSYESLQGTIETFKVKIEGEESL
jgi:oligoribonuclease NrnB/cAMP/cGMP phosphodiesterase (DHH superfamily)